jgi:hypothetical protein
VFGGLFPGGGSLGAPRGPGRALGGPVYPYTRHEVAEGGKAEVLLLGGRGQVFPNETFEGLAQIARLAARAPASGAGAAGVGGVSVNISIKNEAGGEIEAQQRQTRRADGGLDLDIVLRRKTSREIANGDHDRPLMARYGARPILVPR